MVLLEIYSAKLALFVPIDWCHSLVCGCKGSRIRIFLPTSFFCTVEFCANGVCVYQCMVGQISMRFVIGGAVAVHIAAANSHQKTDL